MVAPVVAAVLAPLLQKLATNGLNTIANAVMAKGKEVVEEKLGVKLDSMVQTEEGLYKLKQLEVDHEEFLINAALEEKRIDLDYYKEDMANTKSARDMNTVVQDSEHASWLAKNLPYCLDAGVIAATFVLVGLLYAVDIPTKNKELMYMALGACLTWCGTILNFHRGTSAGSGRKDGTIEFLSRRGAK